MSNKAVLDLINSQPFEELSIAELAHAYLMRCGSMCRRWELKLAGRKTVSDLPNKAKAEGAYLFSLDAIKGRWPEAEKLIARYPSVALSYAYYVIKDRWPEAEETIAQSPIWNNCYQNFLEDLSKVSEAVDSM
ncbi:MAG: hypothetical protein LBE75_05065 [Burkholderiales bacterium]|jgi:hypothetical protein|nr:hypothetical protein [Burkholderiales bacterium]